MKKFIGLFCLVLLAFSVMLTACGEGVASGDNVSKNDGRVSFVGETGEEITVEINEDKTLASYSIVRDDNAPKDVIALAVRLREDIIGKAGAKLDLTTDLVASSPKQIIVKIDEELGVLEYSISAKKNKIYLCGGSLESLTKAVDIFVRNFIYKANSSLLIPAGEGYAYNVDYFFEKLTVDGVDISEFSFYSDPGNETKINKDKKAETLFAHLNDIFAKSLLGKVLPVSEVKKDGEHYIIISCHSLDVNDYSIEIKDGNIYFTGSFLSVEKAAEVFVSEILGYSEGNDEYKKTLDITSADNKTGSLGYAAPYTKDQLLELFVEANGRDDMIITGTHTYGWPQNGSGIQVTADNVLNHAGDVPAILEIDVGKFGPYNTGTFGGGSLKEYDLSILISEGTKHVSEGGIIAVVAHLGNPLSNASDGVFYRGYLGGDNVLYDMITEGTELNTAFKATLKDTLDVIKEYSNNGIPVMFRPLHEMNADWFWWCANQKGGTDLSSAAMADLWKYVYNLVTVEMGCEDVLWVYSTSTNGSTKKDVLYAYPGDDYVDIVGLDWYTAGKCEYNSGDGYANLMTTGKPVALTEVGPADGSALEKKNVDGASYYTYTAVDLLNDIKYMISNGHKISYFSTWVGARSLYGLEDVDVIFEDSAIITRKDLVERWAND